MAKRIMGSTPKEDGYRMPGEFEEQKQVWMLWPERQDNWRNGAKPVQKAYTDVAKSGHQARFEPVTMCVSKEQYANCRARLPEDNDSGSGIGGDGNPDPAIPGSGIAVLPL